MRRVGCPPCVVTHGGAGNASDVVDGCQRACLAALALAEGRALDAAIAAVVVLEDDPRMNAGTGSVLRLEGGSAQMDASAMDADGFGAVAVVENLKNPVKLARAIYDSPHVMLAGAGAMELASRLGLEPADPVTDRQRARHRERLATLGEEPLWRGVPASLWPEAYRAAAARTGASDTVGAVVRAADGSFAAAASTGGIWCALRGRVGDVPIPGAGIWVGPAGAVAATGVGEVIWRELLARRCHDEMARGLPAQAAVDACVAFMRARHPGVDVGLIAVDTVGAGGGATTGMPWATAGGA